ncbi:AMP-binding protein [Rhodococcoides fascians]|uniref:AMP-binding protein n=1 Tax=Rhodococcoides fascians TaxID=1828 RepID=UPI00050CFCDC|nr:AMP-binding protein [Rhodococcus fascians]
MHEAHLEEATDRIIPEILSRQAESIGDDAFLMQDDRQVTYGQASELADSHAQAYASLGIGQGDRVAFLMENSVDQAVTSFGVNRLGAAWSPVSTEYRGEWLGNLLTRIESDVLVVDAKLLHKVTELGDLGFKHIVVKGNLESDAPVGATIHDYASFAEFTPRRPNVDQFYGTTSAILWTSGTTGPSKGVEQSHNVWVTWAQLHNKVYRGGIREGERFYGCIPMYNSGGWSINIYPALVAGVPACIDERFSVSRYWDRIAHYQASHTIVLGTMPLFLLQQPPKDNDADNTLRTVLLNPPIPGLWERFQERFAIETITAGFGQSEIMGATLWTSDMRTKPGSQGFAVVDDHPVECKILDDNDVEVAVGDVGEICVRPRMPFSIFNGYFDDPDRTHESRRNLWHHSGDLGKLDEDGELYFVDRKKDSTRNKGRNISSFEVEHIVRKHPQVLDVAAYGIASSHLKYEDELMIAVLPVDGASIDPLELCQFIEKNAPYFFVPRYVDVVTEFPMTPSKKILKYKLREVGLTSTTWDRESAAPDWKLNQKGSITSLK